MILQIRFICANITRFYYLCTHTPPWWWNGRPYDDWGQAPDPSLQPCSHTTLPCPASAIARRRLIIPVKCFTFAHTPSLGGGMVDTRDLKSLGPKRPCGFDSRPRHTRLCKLLIFKHFTKSCFLYPPNLVAFGHFFLPGGRPKNWNLSD